MLNQKDSALPVSEPEKLWNPAFIQIFIVNITMMMGQFMLNVLLPVYATAIGASASIVGVIISIIAFMSLGARFFAGPATLAFKKKTILGVFAVETALAFCMYGLSKSITMIIISRLLHGIGMGFTYSTALALASDALPRKKLGAGIGIFALGQSLGSAVGPNVGLALADTIGFNNTFFICAAIVFISAVMIFFIKVPEPSERKPFKINFNNIIAKEALPPTAIMFFISMSFGSLVSFVVLFAQNREIANIGLFFTVYAVAVIATRPFISALSDKIGWRKILLPAIVMVGVSAYLISISTSLPLMLVAAVFNGLGFGSCSPATQTLCIKSVTPDRRGVGSSTNFIALDVSRLIGPIISGMIIDRFGYSVMYKTLLIPLVAAIILFLIFYGKIKHIELNPFGETDKAEEIIEEQEEEMAVLS